MKLSDVEPIRVLYVDSDETYAERLATRLEHNRAALSVVVAPDAATGIEKFTPSIDCVVSEQRLPDATGLSLLREIRETAPEHPFFLMTDEGSEALAARATRCGVTGYVHEKPAPGGVGYLAEWIEAAVGEYRDGNSQRIEPPIADTDTSAPPLEERPWEDAVRDDRDSPLSGDGDLDERAAEDDPGEGIVDRDDGDDGATITNDGSPDSVVPDDDPDQLLTESVLPPGEDEEVWKSRLLDAIFERIPVHLFVKDEEARHVLVSRAFVDNPEGFLGKTDEELGIVSDDRARETYEDDLEVIETGEPIIDQEEYYPSIDQWTLTSKIPWYDEDGNVVGLIGVARDITERKKSQQEVERQNERLEEFASVVSHDLRNPLSVASGYVDAAMAECDSEYLEEVRWGLDRMDELIDDVLALARQGQTVVAPDPIELEPLVRDAWKGVGSDEATLVYEAGDTTIEGDRQRVNRLLENLFRNAMDHTETERVTVRVGDLDEGFYVADDGPGVPEEDRECVFETGYTTDPEGTGFGLSVVEQIADAHGWTVAVAESRDGGARFEFTGVDLADCA